MLNCEKRALKKLQIISCELNLLEKRNKVRNLLIGVMLWKKTNVAFVAIIDYIPWIEIQILNVNCQKRVVKKIKIISSELN